MRKIEFAHTILHKQALFDPKFVPPTAPINSKQSTQCSNSEPSEFKIRGVKEDQAKVQKAVEKIREKAQEGPIPPQKVQHIPAGAAAYLPKANPKDPKIKIFPGVDAKPKTGSKPSTPKRIEEEKKAVPKSHFGTPEEKQILDHAAELAEYLLIKEKENKRKSEKLNTDLQNMMKMLNNFFAEDENSTPKTPSANPISSEDKSDHDEMGEGAKPEKPADLAKDMKQLVLDDKKFDFVSIEVFLR